MERQHSRLSFTARPHTGVVACCDMHLRHHWDVVAFGNDYFDVADEIKLQKKHNALANDDEGRSSAEESRDGGCYE